MSALPTTAAPGLQIDVWFDLICPWCLIGKHHLDRALAQWTNEQTDVPLALHWHPVRLIEGVPPEGWDYTTFYLRRLGSVEAVRSRQAQVQAAAEQAGTHIHFAGIRRFPDTAPAHQLANLVLKHQGPQAQQQLIQRLFQAYFQQGEPLGDRTWLRTLGLSLGLDGADIDSALAEPLPPAPAVPGVPFFVFNQRLALSGAQPAEHLLAAMHQALRDTAPTA